MLAVLNDALATYARDAAVPDRRRHRLAADAEQWLFSDDRDWPFSFVNVCDALGIDVAWLRARVQRGSPATTAPPSAAAGAAGSTPPEGVGRWLARAPSSPPT
jgi:hypothetical protein